MEFVDNNLRIAYPFITPVTVDVTGIYAGTCWFLDTSSDATVTVGALSLSNIADGTYTPVIINSTASYTGFSIECHRTTSGLPVLAYPSELVVRTSGSTKCFSVQSAIGGITLSVVTSALPINISVNRPMCISVTTRMKPQVQTLYLEDISTATLAPCESSVIADGYNINVADDLTINAGAGIGLGVILCSDEDHVNNADKPVHSINGVLPDSYGNFTISGGDCVIQTPEGTHGIHLVNNCTPCCSNSEYEATYEAERKIWNMGVALGDAIGSINGRYINCYDDAIKWGKDVENKPARRKGASLRSTSANTVGVLVTYKSGPAKYTFGEDELTIKVKAGDKTGRVLPGSCHVAVMKGKTPGWVPAPNLLKTDEDNAPLLLDTKTGVKVDLNGVKMDKLSSTMGYFEVRFDDAVGGEVVTVEVSDEEFKMPSNKVTVTTQLIKDKDVV